MQVFVKGLGAYNLDNAATGSELKSAVEARLGIPASLQVLVYAGRNLYDGLGLQLQRVSQCSTVHLVYRLCGGKGGFGALLRGAGRAAATENQDACRDLSGRRLRHVNADKKLQEWAAGAKERELEDIGAKHVLELQKAAVTAARSKIDLGGVREVHEEAMNQVTAAVQRGLKRQAEQRPPEPKKARLVTAGLPQLPDLSDSEADSDVEVEVEDMPEPVMTQPTAGAVAVSAH